MPDRYAQLDTNALLTIYAAGEVDAADRAAIERRLASDPALAAALDRLRDAQDGATAALRQLDEVTPVDEAAAVRRASAAIRQWQARGGATARPAVAATPGDRWQLDRRRPWVAGGIAAAAAVLVVSMIALPRRTGQPVAQVLPDPRVTDDSSAADETRQKLEKFAAETLAADTDAAGLPDIAEVTGAPVEPEVAVGNGANVVRPESDDAPAAGERVADAGGGYRPFFDVPLFDPDSPQP